MRVELKKKVLTLLLYIVVGTLGLAFIIYNFSREVDKRNNAPSLNFGCAINTIVRKISFERNGLYINDTLYNAGGISWYSRLYSKAGVFNFSSFKTPFTLRKAVNNDTLHLIKEYSKYYLVISEEVKYASEEK